MNFLFSGESKKYKLECPNCRKMYKNLNTLQVHLALDCGQPKKFSCTVCDFKCKRKFNLATHIINRHLHM